MEMFRQHGSTYGTTLNILNRKLLMSNGYYKLAINLKQSIQYVIRFIDS